MTLYKKRQTIRGLRIVEQPRHLRHFTACLEEIDRPSAVLRKSG